MRIVALLFVLLPVLGLRAQDYSKFPSDTYWVNCGFTIAPETFTDKLCVVIFWDKDDPVSLYHVLRLQKIAKENPQLQLVSLVKGDLQHKIPLSELTAYIQDHGIHHPFGVSAHFSPFVPASGKAGLYAYLFNKSVHPELMASGPKEVMNLTDQVQAILSDRTLKKNYGAWQMTSETDPSFYADPLLELPGSAAVNESENSFFVAENAHHRIVHYGSDGVLKHLIGGPDAGDRDGNLRGARFSYVAGMAYDPGTRQLFFADLGAQKVKAVDVQSGLAYTFLGTGKIAHDVISRIDSAATPLTYPLDVEVHQRSLYILMGSPAQLVKVNTSNGKLESNTILETRLDSLAGAPVRISKGEKGILIVTGNGYVYQVNYEGDVLTPQLRWKPSRWADKADAAAERKGELILLMPRRYSIVSIKKGKEKLIAGSGAKGYVNGDDPLKTKFNQPFDMQLTGSKILVSDRGNHLMRLVTLEKKKNVTRSIVPQYTFEYFTTGDALNTGEPVFFETEVFGSGRNDILLRWDISAYELVENGRNELVSDLTPGVLIPENAITEEGIRFSIDTDQAEEFVQIELYLTLRLKANPDVIVLKKAGLNLSFSAIPGEMTDHELDYSPRLLP